MNPGPTRLERNSGRGWLPMTERHILYTYANYELMVNEELTITTSRGTTKIRKVLN